MYLNHYLNTHLSDGMYLAERIEGEGKLGDRVKVALEGRVGAKYAKVSNTYIIHNEVLTIQPDYLFRDTKSRTIDFCKYKKRPTADLLCIDVAEGEGKYDKMLGSLVLQDFEGRIVSAGSGLRDNDRFRYI